jgi:hypothetical protein
MLKLLVGALILILILGFYFLYPEKPEEVLKEEKIPKVSEESKVSEALEEEKKIMGEVKVIGATHLSGFNYDLLDGWVE